MVLTFLPSVTDHVSLMPRFVDVPDATPATASCEHAMLVSESMRFCAIDAATVCRTPPPICVATDAELPSRPTTPMAIMMIEMRTSTSVMPARARRTSAGGVVACGTGSVMNGLEGGESRSRTRGGNVGNAFLNHAAGTARHIRPRPAHRVTGRAAFFLELAG